MALLFGLGGLFYVAILLVNAIAILSEDRFLARIGWSSQTLQSPSFTSGGGGGGSAGINSDRDGVKVKIVNLITSVRTLMRIPLIVINTFVIVYEVLLG